VRVVLRDQAASSYWLILRAPHPELCTKGVGYVEDLVCETDARTLVDLHLERLTYRQARQAKRLDLRGPTALTRAFPTWFRASPFAPYLPARTATSS
jgi:hypothetical protein